jgi:phosphohistidine phosphatase SixA
MRAQSRVSLLLLSGLVGTLLAASAASAQTLSGAGLVSALRNGGYVIVMRHARSPNDLPDKRTAQADNVNLERQLDEEGRAAATAMGKALRDLKIPIAEVLTSPTYRARETARLAGWTQATIAPELGDNGQGMQQVAPDAQTAWLLARASQKPAAGANAILVTHLPVLTRAFPQASAGLADGEALIVAPDGKGGATVAARVTIAAWPHLAD